ncbi:MAG: Trk family potassium uptake protein [Dehalococcoidia bacterium]|nr:Trk family potassium uptake protein [Dehalococcoidia bacterium]
MARIYDKVWERGRSRVAPNQAPFFIVFIAVFLALIAVGALALSLPLSSRSGSSAGLIAPLFTATSAASLTGLTVVDTYSQWSVLGQAIILVLVQIGGLGFMTISATLLLVHSRRVNMMDYRVQDFLGADDSKSFRWLFIKTVFFVAIVEICGTVLLWFASGSSTNNESRLWNAMFHSISAFNNVGFDLFGDSLSLQSHSADSALLMILGSLAFLGALSAIVFFQIVALAASKRLGLDAKVSLTATISLLIIGLLAIFAFEFTNPDTLGGMSLKDKFFNSLFVSVASRSSGFSSLNISAMHVNTLFVLMCLMFIGGASGSTAGGVKVNTISVLAFTSISYLKARRYVHAFGNRISERQVHQSIAVVFLMSIVVFIVGLLLSINSEFQFIRSLFESVSALGTAGLSTGITSDLSIFGKVVLIVAMVIGRLGPLTLVLAIMHPPQDREHTREEEEDMRIG